MKSCSCFTSSRHRAMLALICKRNSVQNSPLFTLLLFPSNIKRNVFTNLYYSCQWGWEHLFKRNQKLHVPESGEWEPNTKAEGCKIQPVNWEGLKFTLALKETAKSWQSQWPHLTEGSCTLCPKWLLNGQPASETTSTHIFPASYWKTLCPTVSVTFILPALNVKVLISAAL